MGRALISQWWGGEGERVLVVTKGRRELGEGTNLSPFPSGAEVSMLVDWYSQTWLCIRIAGNVLKIKGPSPTQVLLIQNLLGGAQAFILLAGNSDISQVQKHWSA